MIDKLGVPIREFIDATVASYQKGFEDAIECLKAAQNSIDVKKMKESITEEMKKQGKIKAEW
jgi:hypothetical protein